MCLTNEHVGPKILAKIKIYVLTRAELLFTLCYEIPCRTVIRDKEQKIHKYRILSLNDEVRLRAFGRSDYWKAKDVDTLSISKKKYAHSFASK